MQPDEDEAFTSGKEPGDSAANAAEARGETPRDAGHDDGRIRVARWLCAAMVVPLLGCPPAAVPPPAAPKGPTACERASDSMVGAMLARLPASDEPTEAADALRNLIRERCEQDAWSNEATRCLIAMKKLDDATPCARLMTDEQQAALVRDEEARLGAAPGGGSGGASGKPAETGEPGKPAGAGSGAPGEPR